MDTHEQFRESERRTFPIRAVVIVAVLLAGVFLSGDSSLIRPSGILAAVYATYCGIIRLFLLSRFRSDGWIYGMLAGDSILAVTALHLFGPFSPALALPVFTVCYYALFLGYPGAFAAAAAGSGALVAAAATGGTGIAAAALAGPPALAAAAGISGYIAQERFTERARRQTAIHNAAEEARARRILAAIMPLASGGGEGDVARAMARDLPGVVGFPSAVVLLRPRGTETLILAAACMGEGKRDLVEAAAEPVAGTTPAAVATRQGVALVIGEGGLPSDSLPAWALARGYKCGIAAPISAGTENIGAVYVLAGPGQAPAVADLEQTELFLSLAARFLRASRSGRMAAAPEHRLTDMLEEAGRAASSPGKPDIDLPGLRLDAAVERCLVQGVAVSLSRTEFGLLYALAETAGAPADPRTLARAVWADDSSPGASGIDVTVYRLRRKLGKAPGGRNLVQTVRGQGYLLVPPGDPAPAGAPAGQVAISAAD